MEDYLLIKKIQNGDKQAFEILVKKYYSNIYSFCFRRFSGNPHISADITQTVFLKLLQNIHKYKFSGKFSNYLLTITINICNTEYRKNLSYTFDIDSISEKPSKEDIDQNMNRLEEADAVKKALDNLPDAQKEVIILKYYHDLRLREIAEITNVPLPTAKSRLRQGMDKLKKILEKEAVFNEK